MKLIFLLINIGVCLADWPEFFLYTRNNPEQYSKVNSSNLLNSNFNPSSKTYLLIHGFTDSANYFWVIDVKNNLLSIEDANVIAVDWEEGAAATKGYFSSYTTASDNTLIAAKKTAKFLRTSNINPKSIHCIGHSLGAHTCGYIGKRMASTGPKLARISGCDPAGPDFYFTSNRLGKGDADFVDVIHTSLTYGLQVHIGDQDFWPNGGKIQPNCSLDISCNHKRAPQYYAESILDPTKFKTFYPHCSWFSYALGLCNYQKDENNLGFYANPKQSGGDYYLETNGNSPYSKS